MRSAEGRRVPLPPAATASTERCCFRPVERNRDDHLTLAESTGVPEPK